MRVLLVEDSADILALVSESLADMGFEVTSAESGVSALEVLDAVGAPFDAIVSDVSMPNGISGIELASRIKAAARGTHIILVSGYALSQLPPLPPGVLFLHKPYRIQALVDLLLAESPPA